MKGKKKPKGTKARVQASKKRLAHIGTAITVAILVAIIAVSSFLVYSFLNSTPDQTSDPDQTSNQPCKPKAAIVDHLSLTRPNQTFTETAKDILKQAGYTVDYYPGEEVTVEFYRNLPTHEYTLIIFRVHSTVDIGGNQLLLFTCEPYSTTRYVTEQLNDRVGRAAYVEEGPYYFAIGSKFVTSSMNGRFANTIIIMMGCDGLRITSTAKAFIEKGTKVYISWDGSILGTRNDPAITCLLRNLVSEKQTVDKAVADTMKEFAPSPPDDSVLLYYPLEARDYTIESY